MTVTRQVSRPPPGRNQWPLTDAGSWSPQCCHAGHPIGHRHDTLSDGAATSLIAVESGLGRGAAEHLSQRASKVDGVLDAGVHSLASGRAVYVCGVAGEEDWSAAVGGSEAVMDMKA